jgi:hypothetical protein
MMRFKDLFIGDLDKIGDTASIQALFLMADYIAHATSTIEKMPCAPVAWPLGQWFV